MFAPKAWCPIPVLLVPDVFASIVEFPTATLPPPVVVSPKALKPIPILLEAVVRASKEPEPTAVLCVPEVNVVKEF